MTTTELQVRIDLIRMAEQSRLWIRVDGWLWFSPASFRHELEAGRTYPIARIDVVDPRVRLSEFDETIKRLKREAIAAQRDRDAFAYDIERYKPTAPTGGPTT